MKSSRFEFVDKRSLKLTGQRVCYVAEVAPEPFDVRNFQDTLPILNSLPEQSEIRDPVLNISILQFHNAPRGGPADVTKLVNERLRRLQETHNGKMRLQSRYEVLWRTLLFNKWSFWLFGGLPRSYPAPSELGELVGCYIIESIDKQLAVVALAFLQSLKIPLAGLLPEEIALKDMSIVPALDWKAEAEKLGEMIAAWHKLEGEQSWDDDRLVIPPSLAHFLQVMQEDDSSDNLRREVIKDLLLRPVNTTYLPTESQSDLSRILKEQVDQGIRSNSQQRRLFATKTARLGLGPESMEIGDEVWIVESGAMPLIMRPVGGDGEYILVGEAYVHGIMHGEAVSGAKVEEICLI